MSEEHKHEQNNVSADLIWECVRNNNSYLCKRKTGGGIQFSRDPLNLVNKHNRKYAGFVNDQAIGIHADSNTVSMMTKLPSRKHQPIKSHQTSSFSASTSGRKLYRNVVNSTAKRGYRSDLRGEAVSRASAVKMSQREKKDLPEKKPRGAKARKAAAEKA